MDEEVLIYTINKIPPIFHSVPAAPTRYKDRSRCFSKNETWIAEL